MNDIVKEFKNEYMEDFSDLNLIPESLLEQSAEQLKTFITLKRDFGESKIMVNIYPDNGDEHIEISESEKHVDIMAIYDTDAVYELIYEYDGE